MKLTPQSCNFLKEPNFICVAYIEKKDKKYFTQ